MIMHMFGCLPQENVYRLGRYVDYQPMHNGGIIINVAGQLQTNNAPLMSFKQTFIICKTNGRCFIQHDIFRAIVV